MLIDALSRHLLAQMVPLMDELFSLSILTRELICA